MQPEPSRDPVAQALSDTHRALALVHGLARRYPRAVAPFAALAETTPAALADLTSLLEPGETVYLLTEQPPHSEHLRPVRTLAGLQMIFPEDAPLPASAPHLHVEPLTCEQAPEMLHLIHLAFPGFFRSETCRMGPYFGLRDLHGELIAMGGTRLAFSGWREISGLCSHPAHAGKGLGSAILGHLLALHRAQGLRSFLHVGADNAAAIRLYHRLGFQTLRSVPFHGIERTPG